MGEYLPHIFERAFVHLANACTTLLRGHIFVHGRTLAPQAEHEANKYEYLFVLVFVRGAPY